MAYQSAELLSDRRDGGGHIPVRVEGTCARAHKAGKETDDRKGETGLLPLLSGTDQSCGLLAICCGRVLPTQCPGGLAVKRAWPLGGSPAWSLPARARLGLPPLCLGLGGPGSHRVCSSTLLALSGLARTNLCGFTSLDSRGGRQKSQSRSTPQSWSYWPGWRYYQPLSTPRATSALSL